MSGAVVTLCVVGCDGPTTVPPTGGDTPGDTPGDTTSATTRPPRSTFSNDELCGLLTADESARLGADGTPEPSFSIGSANPICSWDGSATGLTVEFAPGVLVDTVEQRSDETKAMVTVLGRPAVRFRTNGVPEFCQILVDVSPTSSMAFRTNVHDDGSGFEVCDLANELATIVLPKVKG